MALSHAALAQESAQSDPLEEGKANLAAGDYQRASVLFANAASKGNVEAQELLGLAYERAGQLAQARAAYQTYLKAHPAGPDAQRVRDRLSGVEAAMETEAQAQLAERKKAKLEQLATTPKPPPPPSPGAGASPKSDLEAGKWTWQRSGSAGQYYARNDGFDGLGLLRGSLAGHDLAQDQLVSSGDVMLRGTDGASTITTRFSAANRTGIESGDGNATAVSSAFVDLHNKDSGISARIGRQTRYGGGVFGRFDGAVAGLEASDHVLLQAVAGSPVYYGDNEPFADGRFFVGASIDLTSASKVWTGSLYAIEQDVGSAVDRRALGGDIRYGSQTLQTDAGLDYDIFYGELNNAYVSGTWQPSERWSLSANLDYRRVPFLLTSNALLGQPVDSLSELFALYGSSDAEALAVDRTATEASANLSLSYQFNEHWNVSADGTAAKYSGTPASGGVGAVPAPGVEYNLTARLDGSDVFTEGDYAGLSLALIESDLYLSVIGDASLRYPLREDLRVTPRLRLAYREGKDSGTTTQFLVMPSLAASYQLTDHWSFESEAAVLWENDRGPSGRNDHTEFRILVGYRYAF